MSAALSFLKEYKVKIALLAVVELLILCPAVYYYGTFSPSKIVLAFAGVGMVIVAVVAALMFLNEDSKKAVNRIFLSVLLVLGCFYMAVFPPNSAPDEMFHFQASYKYSDMMLGEEVSSSHITVRAEDKCLFDDNRVKVSMTHYKDVAKNVSFFAEEEGTISVSTLTSFEITENLPQMKVASALGLSIGKVLGLGAYPAYYLGRFFNLLSFILLAYFAFKLTPVGRPIFAIVPLLPMPLHLASSYSYDVAIIGMGLLLSALCLKAVFDKGYIKKRLLVGIAVLIFLIAPCKVVYSSIALLVLFIPKERFKNRKLCWAVKGGLLFMVIAAVLSIRLSSMMAISNVAPVSDGAAAPALDHRGEDTGKFYSLADVLADPFGVALMYVNSFGILGSWYIETAIGGSLGWFQPEIVAPNVLMYAFIALILVAALKSDSDKDVELSVGLRIVFILIAAAVCALVGASMLLGHTFVGEEYIKGIQGRYILPVAALLLLALQNKMITFNGNSLPVVVIGAVALNMLYLDYIFANALIL